MTAFLSLKERPIGKVVRLPIEEVHPNSEQARTDFDSVGISALADSIRQNGIIQPLTVRKVPDGYEVIAGERRLRASKIAGLDYVPCIILEVSDRNSAILNLVENIQHKELSFFDEAVAIDRLIKSYGLTQEDTALKLGKAQSTIANKLRLLKLTDEERMVIVKFGLTERHARALLKLSAPEDRMNVINLIVKERLNVEKTEKAILEYIDENNLKNCGRKRTKSFSDVRFFINTINRAIENMQSVGIKANSSKYQCDEYIEYRVRIPLKG
jgi:ParB family chromosome partitioning protein